ncbi:MAG: hypothetical protein J6Y62_01105 [Clostridia bacterium]|nr:hypothetical protein [Clostridia bacterium]
MSDRFKKAFNIHWNWIESFQKGPAKAIARRMTRRKVKEDTRREIKEHEKEAAA